MLFNTYEEQHNKGHILSIGTRIVNIVCHGHKCNILHISSHYDDDDDNDDYYCCCCRTQPELTVIIIMAR